ncbi:hypothetical protein M918_01575 [Clostridium sp. BL8]|nr:hypothetical protein M918_01575 [Clostridium sp. BL8]
MARVKRAVNARKKHKKNIKTCKRILRWKKQVI